MEYCSAMRTFLRYYSNQDFVHKHVKDQNLTDVGDCLRNKNSQINSFYDTCTDECYNPCYEQNIKYKDRYAWENVSSRVTLRLFYEDSRETKIEEVPRYDEMTLLSNLGGQLGLMVGMSALSVMEILVWFILLLIDHAHRLLYG